LDAFILTELKVSYLRLNPADVRKFGLDLKGLVSSEIGNSRMLSPKKVLKFLVKSGKLIVSCDFVDMVEVIFGTIILMEGEILKLNRSFMRNVKEKPIDKPPVNFGLTFSKVALVP